MPFLFLTGGLMHVPMDVEARGWPLLFRYFSHMSDYGMVNCLLIELSSQPIFYFLRHSLMYSGWPQICYVA